MTTGAWTTGLPPLQAAGPQALAIRLTQVATTPALEGCLGCPGLCQAKFRTGIMLVACQVSHHLHKSLLVHQSLKLLTCCGNRAERSCSQSMYEGQKVSLTVIVLSMAASLLVFAA